MLFVAYFVIVITNGLVGLISCSILCAVPNVI